MPVQGWISWKAFEDAPGLAGRILLFLALLAPATARAQSLVEALAEASRQNLAEDPTWRRLLHFEGDARRSSILDDDFFLDPAGQEDPRAELIATLRAYFDRREGIDDEHPRCRFPARYWWLSQRLRLPGYERHIAECAKLESWALLEDTKSISMILVSGFLGNPASTFGHTLLRFNSDSPDDREGLFDLSINFGALIPERENPILYVLRGLSGRYDAGFSDRYYYTQDLVYTRTEFRDMWEYRLDLDESQRTLLVLHAWEIVGRKFRYFFTSKNCGYRMAELLQLVLPEQDLIGGKPWYAPVEMFFRLEQRDRELRGNGERGLIQSLRYIPSSRRRLQAELSDLRDDEMRTLNRYAKSPPGRLGPLVAELPEARRAIVLDGLLAYQHYRLAIDRPDSNDAAWAKNREILLARLLLPAARRNAPRIPERPSPVRGFPPAQLAAGYAHDETNWNFATIGLSPFVQESVGQNGLEGNELAVVDFSFGVEDESPAVFLDRFDLIRILSLNGPSLRVSGERTLSWRLRIAVDRMRHGTRHDYDGLFSYGVGRAVRFGPRVTTFALLNLQAHTAGTFARAQPESGLLLGFGRLRGRAGFALASTDYEGTFRRRWDTRWMLQLGQRTGVWVEASEAERLALRAGISRFY